jgi:hypothetical protein
MFYAVLFFAFISTGQVDPAPPAGQNPDAYAVPKEPIKRDLYAATVQVGHEVFIVLQPAGVFIDITKKNGGGHYAWVAAPWPRESDAVDLRLFEITESAEGSSVEERVFFDDFAGSGAAVLYQQTFGIRDFEYTRDAYHRDTEPGRSCLSTDHVEICAMDVRILPKENE